MATYYGFTSLFVALSAALILSAAIRRDWRGLLYAALFTGPAAIAWIAYVRYESNLDLGVAPIRIDLPFLRAGLTAVSLPAVLYAVARAVELLFGFGIFGVHFANQRRSVKDGPLRPWQDPLNPRDPNGEPGM